MNAILEELERRKTATTPAPTAPTAPEPDPDALRDKNDRPVDLARVLLGDTRYYAENREAINAERHRLRVKADREAEAKRTEEWREENRMAQARREAERQLAIEDQKSKLDADAKIIEDREARLKAKTDEIRAAGVGIEVTGMFGL
jgi:hypothetical protein